MAPSPAQAKDELAGVLVCGADRCSQLDHRALHEAAGILSHPSFRRSGGALPFYDVLFVWHDRDGRPATYGALRWVPRAGATRTWSRGPVWSRTGVALTAALSTATLGLRPRPPSDLDDPVDAVGSATAAARRELARPGAPSRSPAVSEPADGWLSLAVMAGLAAVLLVAIAAATIRGPARRHAR
jgi:hypothetical protein